MLKVAFPAAQDNSVDYTTASWQQCIPTAAPGSSDDTVAPGSSV